MSKILIVDDEVVIRRALEKFLASKGHEILCAEDGVKALKVAEENIIDLALVDLVMPKMDGIEFITKLKIQQPEAVAIVLTAFGTISSAVQAMKAGAYHYITKPFELDDVGSLIYSALEHKNLKRENVELKIQLKEKYRFENIVGTSEPINSVFDMVERVAPTDSTILILGESGTGKELIAKAIHFNSLRRDAPLVIVNCAAIPEGLLESELFGHVRGSFTGAIANKMGKFEAADTGTIFLDEIGDMSMNLQVKLLRVLQEQCFESVGSTKTHKVDVRIIAATNQDLEKAVKEKRFREDLYYRLNVIPVFIPPLRERRSDIPILLDHFIQKFNTNMKHNVTGIGEYAMEALESYNWPGNVRELENLVERLVVLHKEGLIEPDELPSQFRNLVPHVDKKGVFCTEIPDEGMSFKDAVDEFENSLIIQALKKTGGNKNQAATLLGLNRTTLVEKIKKKGIDI
ncbi:MAG: sigma-54 dependent transcriptional regulator [Pseudomonadota bacterium]